MAKKNTKTTITSQDLKQLKLLDSQELDPRFNRLKTKLLTCSFIDSIPSVMERIKEENPEKYAFLCSQFIAIIDKHDVNMEKLRLEKIKVEQNEKRLQLLAYEVQKKYEQEQSQEQKQPSSYSNAVIEVTELLEEK